jgi:hypothetical protein
VNYFDQLMRERRTQAAARPIATSAASTGSVSLAEIRVEIARLGPQPAMAPFQVTKAQLERLRRQYAVQLAPDVPFRGPARFLGIDVEVID